MTECVHDADDVADPGSPAPLSLLETTRAYAMWQCGYAGPAACGKHAAHRERHDEQGKDHGCQSDGAVGENACCRIVNAARRPCLLKTSRLVKLSNFRRVRVENRKILLKLKFCVGAAAPLGYRLRGRTAIRRELSAGCEADGKQDRGDAAEGRDAGEGGSRDPAG